MNNTGRTAQTGRTAKTHSMPVHFQKPDPVSSAFATLNRAQSAIISSGAFWVSHAMPLHWQGAMATRR
jgi:hypothetical protein